jgi:hypothetical protein
MDTQKATMAAEIILHTPTNTDVWSEMLDYHLNGTLTTGHPTSSYGQPVALVNGDVIDYAQVKTVHLLGASVEDWQKAAQALAPFGIRVTRQAGD